MEEEEIDDIVMNVRMNKRHIINRKMRWDTMLRSIVPSSKDPLTVKDKDNDYNALIRSDRSIHAHIPQYSVLVDDSPLLQRQTRQIRLRLHLFSNYTLNFSNTGKLLSFLRLPSLPSHSLHFHWLFFDMTTRLKGWERREMDSRLFSTNIWIKILIVLRGDNSWKGYWDLQTCTTTYAERERHANSQNRYRVPAESDVELFTVV